MIRLQNHLWSAGELIPVSYVTNNVSLLFQIQEVFEVYKLEISHEYIVLSKSIFVGNFHKKPQSSFVYVAKVGTRDFNKISIKLLNRCVGLSGPPDIGLAFKSSGQWWINQKLE